MLLMGKKPEDWPRDTPAPPEPHELVGAAGGIIGGWNYPVHVYRCGDGKLWSQDDRGWYERTEEEIVIVARSLHDPAICGPLLVQRGKWLEEYERDPDGTARAYVEQERTLKDETVGLIGGDEPKTHDLVTSKVANDYVRHRW